MTELRLVKESKILDGVKTCKNVLALLQVDHACYPGQFGVTTFAGQKLLFGSLFDSSLDDQCRERVMHSAQVLDPP